MATTISPAATPTAAASTTSQISSARTSARSVCGDVRHGLAELAPRRATPSRGGRAGRGVELALGGWPLSPVGRGSETGDAQLVRSGTLRTINREPADRSREYNCNNPSYRASACRVPPCRLQVVLDEGLHHVDQRLVRARSRATARAHRREGGRPAADDGGDGRVGRRGGPGRRRPAAPARAPRASRRPWRCMPGGLTLRSRPMRLVSMLAACSSQSTARRGLQTQTAKSSGTGRSAGSPSSGSRRMPLTKLLAALLAGPAAR